MKFSLINIFLFFSSVFCHMAMKDPPPRKSQFSEYYLLNNDVDYDIVAPLNVNNYSYPCKGFKKGPSTKIIKSNKIDINIYGNAPHNGGHCQFGISFDNKNFVVLKQVIRTCLIPDGLNYSFDLPLDFPDGNIIVFWTWINAIGNREYYMDCADIKIQMGNPQTNITIKGKEVLIANLPGYPIIPEFPNKGMYKGMYDGRELFLNVNDKIIFKPNLFNSTNIKSSTNIFILTKPFETLTNTKYSFIRPTVPEHVYSYAIKNSIKFSLSILFLIIFIIIN